MNPFPEGTMDKLLIAYAALAFAVAVAPAEAGFIAPLSQAFSPLSLVHTSGCEDECAEYMEERASAIEEATEEAYEAGYAPRRRHVDREERSASARKQRAEEERPARKAKSDPETQTAEDSAQDSAKDSAKPAPAKSSDGKNAVASTASPGNCKQYFASVDMTASVPCE
jgi:hypothetical protein